MQNQIGIDVGYGYTKAVSRSGAKVRFPSVVAPSPHNMIGEHFKSKVGHKITIGMGQETRTHLVGELAARSPLSMLVASRHKPEEMHDTLMLAAAYIAGATSNTKVGLGLPLAFYKTQKDQLLQRLRRMDAWVSVDGAPERRITFSDILILPQGVGAVYALWDDMLPESGLVGLMDIGTHTTDYLLLKMSPNDPVPDPLLDGCGSIEAGASLVHRAIASEYNRVTGAILSDDMLEQATNRQSASAIHNGRVVDLSGALDEILSHTTQSICHAVKRAWGTKGSQVNPVILCGGGALLFGDDVKKMFPNVVIAPDPSYSNAAGYLAAMEIGDS